MTGDFFAEIYFWTFVVLCLIGVVAAVQEVVERRRYLTARRAALAAPAADADAPDVPEHVTAGAERGP